MKKSLRGKTLIKNFSNALVVLVTTISPAKGQAEMIDYTFLLPGKNDICKPHFPPPPVSTGKTAA
ncbi:MAG TPA: hypothetical protein VMV32_00520 [Ignavibacteriaceae bacterium]|nr:hypothetical protein [Ignavibacteriaceae bacterium]